MSSNRDLTVRRIVNLTAFVGVVCIAVALLLQCLFNWCGWDMNIANSIREVGEWIAVVITCISAWFYVATKRRTAWYVIYAISITAILILLILR